MHHQLTQALVQTNLEEIRRLRRPPRSAPGRSVRLGTRSAVSTAAKTFFTAVPARLIPAR